jgi:hypothetical protein
MRSGLGYICTLVATLGCNPAGRTKFLFEALTDTIFQYKWKEGFDRQKILQKPVQSCH